MNETKSKKEILNIDEIMKSYRRKSYKEHRKEPKISNHMHKQSNKQEIRD